MTTWTYDPKQTGQPVIDSKTGQRICDVDCVDPYELYDNDEDVEAYEEQVHKHGHLLAAAPELLAALQGLLYPENVQPAFISLMRKKALAAINKAKGE